MKKWLRRIRGAIGMGLIWATALFAVSFIPWLVMMLLDTVDVPFPILFAAFGFVGGAMFSTVLGLVEGRGRFDQMSLPRFAGWGAVGGLLLAGLWVFGGAAAIGGEATPLENLLFLGPLFSAAGAGFAAGSLALARRAADRDLLEAGEEALGLTEGESAQ